MIDCSFPKTVSGFSDARLLQATKTKPNIYQTMFKLIAAAALLVAAVAGSASPQGDYCGDFMGIVEGKATFPQAGAARGNLTLTMTISGEAKTCANEPYTVNPKDSTITITQAADATSCIGKLLKDNDIPSLSVTYSPGDDSVDLDVDIADVTLEKC